VSTLVTSATASGGEERGARPTAPGARPGWARFCVLATPIVGVTFFSKFTIPPLGEQGIDVSLFLVLGAVVAGAAAGCIRVDSARLTLYVALFGILGLIQSLQPETFSIPSMLLLAGLHLPYVVAVSREGGGDRTVFNRSSARALFSRSKVSFHPRSSFSTTTRRRRSPTARRSTVPTASSC
jgi:hypothetical protein